MKNIFMMNILLCSLLTSHSAMAFIFEQSEATAYLSASSFPNTLGNVTSPASGTASVQADGTANSLHNDVVKIESVWFNPEFSKRGFTLQIKVSNQSWRTIDQSIGNCVWIDEGCSSNRSGSVDNYPTLPVSVRLVRNSTDAYAAIPAGTGIATVNLRHYSRTQPNGYETARLHFLLNGSVTPIVPTCSVSSYDNSVTLPEVPRKDIIKYSWRYQAVSKEFAINLACENAPDVSVTFNGTKMDGADHALKNLNSGNPNVGIQIMYGDTPLEIGAALKVASSAANSVTLKFKAYYWTNGGTVNAGAIRSNSEFTFNYQ